MAKARLHELIQRELDAITLPYAIDSQNGFYRIKITGRLVASVPHHGYGERGHGIQNTIGHIRRFVRDHTQGELGAPMAKNDDEPSKRSRSAAEKRAIWCKTHLPAKEDPMAKPDSSVAALTTTALTPISNAPAPTSLQAEEPRKPTQADRRRILDEIEARWNHERNCYTKAFSDQAIAMTLMVPRAWVSEVREFAFGADTNEARDAVLAEVAELKKALAKAEEQVLAAMEALDTIKTRLSKLETDPPTK